MLELRIELKDGGEELYSYESLNCDLMDDFATFVPDVSVVQLATITYFPRTPISSVSILVLNGEMCN